MKKMLLRIGFIRLKDNGEIRWPFHTPPKHIFWLHLKHGAPFDRFYVFRNLPGVIKWEDGRLLPRRWGFGFCGFEFGDRG